MPLTEKQKLGKWGEDEAVHFLLSKGYEILARNYNLPKKGEIDVKLKKNICMGLSCMVCTVWHINLVTPKSVWHN